MLKKLFQGKELEKGAKFIAIFAAIFIPLYITAPFYLYFVELAFTQLLIYLLGFFGSPASITSFSEPVQVALPNLSFQISFLCTGLIELFVLIAAILASTGIATRKKLYGLLGAFDIVILFNLARIMFTLNLLQTAGQELADFAHDFLFRLSLFIVVVGFYGLWFYWATQGQVLSRLKE